MLKKMLVLLLVLSMASALIACGRTGSDPAAESGSAPVGSNPGTAPDGEQVLKIGFIGNMGWATGQDTVKALELKTDMVNDAGGITVSGQAYTIQLITYDSNNDQATMAAAANRLIFEDGVKFICTDGTLVDSIIPITEENQVLLCTPALSPAIFNTAYLYSFETYAINSGVASVAGWLAGYSDEKTITIAYADNEMGNMAQGLFGNPMQQAGLEVTFLSYPDSTSDLSALGTKIRNTDPGWFVAVGGTLQPYAAAYNAGYDGQFFYPTNASTASILQELSLEQAEGMIAQADPTEFETPPTPAGVDFKAAWIDSYGEWTFPSISFAANYYCILAAIEEAGSLDTKVVADLLGSGFGWDSPTGYFKMVARPDLGNARTVDSVQSIYLKQIVNGKSVLLDTITIEQSEAYFLASIS